MSSRSKGRGNGNASQSSNSRTADNLETPNLTATLQDELVATTAKIEQLKAQLTTQNSLTLALASSNLDRLAIVLEAFSKRLDQMESRVLTLASGLGKSTKLLDPPILTDGKNSTFKRQRVQMQDKLRVNTNYF